jgi:phage terminase small subunit
MVKLTIKRERFAHLFVQMGNAMEAYKLAFDVAPTTKAKCIKADAHNLLKDPKVAQRVEELREKVRKLHDLKMEDIMAELDENRDLALREKQPSAANQATMGKAKVGGFLIDKVAVDITLRGLAERMRSRRQKGGAA